MGLEAIKKPVMLASEQIPFTMNFIRTSNENRSLWPHRRSSFRALFWDYEFW
jgi:hypothetical protein